MAAGPARVGPKNEGTILRFSLALVVLVAAALPCQAQSIISGSLAGTVTDTAGQAVPNAHLVLTDQAGAFTHDVSADDVGRFAFTSLPPGVYSLFAEQLGFRPVVVTEITIRTASDVPLDVRLEPAAPPVNRVDTVAFSLGRIAGSEAGDARWVSALELSRLPDERREAADALRMVTVTGPDLGIEGLPGRFTRIAVDGVPYFGVQDGNVPRSVLGTEPFPRSALSEAAVLPGGLDVEWAGAAGGILSGQSARGTGTFTARAFGDWTGGGLSSSKFFDPGAITHSSPRGGLLLSGPIIRDTAQFLIGVEARRLEDPAPPVWGANPAGLDSALASAVDSLGVKPAPYNSVRYVRTNAVTGFGRVDWQPAAGQQLGVRVNVADYTMSDGFLGQWHLPAIGVDVHGRDLAGAATFSSTVGSASAVELKVGAEQTTRDYGSGALPATYLANEPIAFGADQALPGTFKETGFTASSLLRLLSGSHQFKVGMALEVMSFDRTFRPDAAGTFVFAGPTGLSAGTGAFDQSVGRPPIARYTTFTIGGFAQDWWQAAPGVHVLLGFRLEGERVPVSQLLRNRAWFNQTGLANDSLPLARIRFMPRFGLVWDLANQHRWIVRAESGLYEGRMDPGLFSELVTENGSSQMRRAVGAVGPWPSVPDSTVAPADRATLTLFGPQFTPPRTARSALGVTGALGGGTTLHLDIAYRHTDFLPRRKDLNLVPQAQTVDQYGRPIYGTLTKVSSLVLPIPGSNRRFDGFDAVSAIDPDGYSDYVGVTARLEHRLGRRMNLVASYTHSRTQDNWLSTGDGGRYLGLSPFPDSIGGVDWTRGRSDFDIPNRLAVGAELNFGALKVSGVYSYHSGTPFTPGFPPGVDVNGDGSWSNDPAYVDDQIKGVSGLFGSWNCLRTQVGRFVGRNSCRAPGVTNLDLRFVLGPLRVGYPVEVVVDALHLVEPDLASVDRALYLVDATQGLTTDPKTGAVNIPLVINPHFGKPIARTGIGRTLRIGLRVNP